MERVEQIQKEYENLQKSVVETIQENTQQYEKKVEEYRQIIQKMKIESVEKRESGVIDGNVRLQLEARDQQIQSMKVVLFMNADLIVAIEEKGCGDYGTPILCRGDDEKPVVNLYHWCGLLFTCFPSVRVPRLC